MKVVLAGPLIAMSLLAAAPASAQRLEVGPDGPAVDLRSRGQRERDIDRDDVQRDVRPGEVRRERRDLRRGPETDDDDDED